MNIPNVCIDIALLVVLTALLLLSFSQKFIFLFLVFIVLFV